MTSRTSGPPKRVICTERMTVGERLPEGTSSRGRAGSARPDEVTCSRWPTPGRVRFLGPGRDAFGGLSSRSVTTVPSRASAATDGLRSARDDFLHRPRREEDSRRSSAESRPRNSVVSSTVSC
jgi:hypothetical protein